MANKAFLLILDDDADILKEVSECLDGAFEVKIASTIKEARDLVSSVKDQKEVSVLVADMRLQEDEEGGLTLARELFEKEARPEIVILTAHANIANASKCMQVGTYGYVEKGREDTFDLLEDLCIQASKRWHRKWQQIYAPMLDGPVALLFGEIVTSSDPYVSIGESDTISMERTLHRSIYQETEAHDGYVTKFTGDGFLAIFENIEQAVKASLAMQRRLTCDLFTNSDIVLQLRESIHWGEVSRLRVLDGDDITGEAVLECIRAVEKADSGQVVISQKARDVLGDLRDFEYHDLDERYLKEIKEPSQIDATMAGQAHEVVFESIDPPEWARIAIDIGKEIEKMGSELPASLAEHHDYYAHRKPTL